VDARALQIAGYQFIPDLNEDGWASVKDMIETNFHADTGYYVNITFDSSYTLNTYDPVGTAAALTTGGIDLFEIDTIILGYLLNVSAIRQIPDAVDFSGYGDNTLSMIKGFRQINGNRKKYGHPSYSCSNIYYSYDSSITDNDNVDDLVDWIHHRMVPHGTAKVGWTNDFSQDLSLRLNYIDSYLDSHSDSDLYLKRML